MQARHITTPRMPGGVRTLRRTWFSGATRGPANVLAGGMMLCGALFLAAACAGAGDDEDGRCGPSRAVVERVIDGDTVELVGGERVRYLLIDTPEISGDEPECWGLEATQANRDLVEGVEVALSYDVECRDVYGRLLAYVRVGDRVINEVMLERGHACVLHIPPNGEDYVASYENLQTVAEATSKGLWGSCESVPCN